MIWYALGLLVKIEKYGQFLQVYLYLTQETDEISEMFHWFLKLVAYELLLSCTCVLHDLTVFTLL